MPIANASLEDLAQMFNNSLVIHKNKPIKITRFNSKTNIKAFDLVSQRNIDMEVDTSELKAPGRCFGFVNFMDYVIYISRNPVRRYKVGICQESANFQAPQKYVDILHSAEAQRVYAFTCPEIVDTVYNRYPSIPDVHKQLVNGAKIVAFDRQFAIDQFLNVYYKLNKVGKLKEFDIQFDKGWEHLTILLDNNHEKSIPIFK